MDNGDAISGWGNLQTRNGPETRDAGGMIVRISAAGDMQLAKKTIELTTPFSVVGPTPDAGDAL